MNALNRSKTLMRLIRFVAYLILICTGSNAQSHSGLYQVDLIVFTYTHPTEEQREETASVLIPTQSSTSIPLQPATPGSRSSTYNILQTTATPLQADWNRIQQQPQYHPLFHYTWLQPNNNQRPVGLSVLAPDGWQVNGTLRVRKSNYYLLDTQLIFSPPHSHQRPFVFNQTQRLKPGNTYYLDHPQAGMLIRISRIH